MDAFYLSLAYGTKKINNKLPITVGIFHFIMPLLGNFVGNIIMQIIKIKPNIIVSIILIFIGINMCVKKEETKQNIENIIELFTFSLAVSLDSFSVGISLKTISNNIYLSSIIFSITAGIITYLGLKLGNKISKKIGIISPILGGIILTLIGLTYIFR